MMKKMWIGVLWSLRTWTTMLLSVGLLHVGGYGSENVGLPAAGSNVLDSKRGYTARACGFDIDRDGQIGGSGDADVGDGVTTDPDGDGTDEDILYVDAADGNDASGDGSARRPYKTIQKALDECDGPGDGAEDIVCIHGTFRETVTFRHSGVAGHYIRDGFQFPDNPTMLIGWDKDDDGQYPPYDPDDEAVLDGNVDGNTANCLYRAIDQSRSEDKISYLEIAHLTIRNYGYKKDECGAMRLFQDPHDPVQSHVYVHDVEMHNINRGHDCSSSTIVVDFWGGVRRHVALINCLADEFGAYFCRAGMKRFDSQYFRFQNLTLKFYGKVDDTSTGWKLWSGGNVEIIDNVIDANPRAWGGDKLGGKGVVPGIMTQDWVIRNNEFHDCMHAIVVHADAGPRYGRHRPVDNILIDGNVFRQSYVWNKNSIGIMIEKGELLSACVANVAITNNFFWSDSDKDPNAGWVYAIHSQSSNDEDANHPGVITIAGNTFYGHRKQNPGSGVNGVIHAFSRFKYPQNNWIFKNNLITHLHSPSDNYSVYMGFAPDNWIADGNVYDSNGRFRWDGKNCDTLADWQRATGQDANSTVGQPRFVDAANCDLHLDANDTVARGAGVDLSGITDHDYDGDQRHANTKTAGADVP